MRVSLQAVAVLLAAGVATAAPPELKLTAVKSKSGKVYTVTADAPGAKAVRFKLVGDAEVLSGPTDRVMHVVPSGPVTVLAVASNETGELSDFASVLVGDAVPVPPGPGPKPPEPPKPIIITTSIKYVVIVEETADGVAGRGAFFADPALAASRKSLGWSFRVVDKDVVGPDGKPPADVARWLDLAAGKPYPSVFLLDGTGKLLLQAPLPATPAGLLGLISGGGN